MKPSEKILLSAFALLFLVIVGGGIGSYALNNYRQVTAETESLKTRLQKMSTTIAQGAEWKKRSEFVDAHVPKLGSWEQASSKLYKTAQDEASIAGLKISTNEMVPRPMVKEGESLGYFDKASVKITFNDANEEALFKWMWKLYSLKSFIGVTRLAIAPNPQGKSVNAEVELTQFYRETTPTKLSKN